MKEESGLTGRPTKYRPEYDFQVEKLCRLGMTDKELSDYFEISEVTLNAWKKQHSSFMKSIRAGKEDSDAEVTESLFKSAKGYTEGDQYYPPHPTSAIFWLKNRRRHTGVKWADKVEAELSGPNGESLVADPMELARTIAFVLNQVK